MNTPKTVKKTQLQAVRDLTTHTTAIENLRPVLREILQDGDEHVLHQHVASEAHNLAHIVSMLTLYLR